MPDQRRESLVGCRDRGCVRQQDVVADPVDAEVARPARQDRATRGGHRARRRGRSATSGRARRACSCSSRSGPGSSRTRRARRPPPPSPGSATRSTAGLNVIEPGRKSSPRFLPDARDEQVVDLLVRLAVGDRLAPRATSHDVRHPAARSPGRSRRRATPRRATRGPCPAPRNFTTYRPSSSASTRPGSEPPSRNAVT